MCKRVQRVVVAASPQFLAALRQPACFACKTVQPRLRRGCTVLPLKGQPTQDDRREAGSLMSDV